MSPRIEPDELAQRRSRARRTAALVALTALAIYAMFWLGGVLRA